ncbi:phosphate/phosphite/phosphonate ABC transporter substrate-binding protein [Actinotalea sp. C106]|uniref:phosphate/phosphite/phosphonate ABC transporter substrate-binding protein n=1 Tax=Actinotalea sp. C106 TaxID=2908644 RepID=UPI0020286478|nr:phosphate/phosphite/phosphonate ABC transporter substrate-binding protein [Actinotalea sp. C106]
MNTPQHGIRAGLLVTGAVLAMSSLAACADQSASAAPTTLRFAVTDLQGLEELQREYGAFKDVLEEHTGLEVEFYAVNDRTAAAAALDNDHVDVVFTGPAEYVVIHENTGAEPVVAIRRPGYRSCVYTSSESGITAMDQLEGEQVAMSDIGSTSGHLGPSQVLLEAGLEHGDNVTVLTVGDAVHEALVRGDVAAVGIGCHDYEEFMATAEDPSDFTLLAEGDPLPPDLLMARDGLDEETVETLREAFEGHFPELLEAMLEGKDNAKYSGAELVVVGDSDYDVVRSMFKAIGVDDFTEFVG